MTVAGNYAYVADGENGQVIFRVDTGAGYDANGNGIIDKNEAAPAVIDYFSGFITKQEAINVVLAYFGG